MIEEQDFGAIESAVRNYRHYPNVCGISFGSKFSNGIIDPVQASVQFFVTEKVPLDDLKKRLPRFVYARHPDGSLDRSRKLSTDVIDLVDLELCCAAGNEIASAGIKGTTTLIFKNKANLDQTLVLTCSHVVSGLDQSPPENGRMTGGHDTCLFFAQALGNSMAQSNVLDYDIAVGEVSIIDDLVEGQIDGDHFVLDGFAGSAIFQLDQLLSVSSDISDNQFIAVNSARTRLDDIEAGGGRKVSMKNVFVCTGAVEKGDSGGIVYDGTKAVGIVVAKAKDDWVLVQPLDEAVAYLADQLGIAIECF